MFRRVSLLVSIVALWCVVWFQSDGREVARGHARSTFAPVRSIFAPTLFDSPDEPFDVTRAEERIVSASRVPQEASPLVERFPRDVTLLAVCLRGHRALLSHHRAGPLLSVYPAWSVRIRELPPPVIAGAPPLVGDWASDGPSPQQTAEALRFAARGQKLEPQNTFWDWMEMAALLAAGRENELGRVLARAAQKREWNDHITDEMRATALCNQRKHALAPPAAKAAASASIQFRHLASIRNVANALAQGVMGLRLQGRDDEALRQGLRAMRLARLVRLRADVPITSLCGAAAEGVAIRYAQVQPGKPIRWPLPTPPSFVARQPTTLLLLAHARAQPGAAREISLEWTRQYAWRTQRDFQVFGDVVSPSTLEGLIWTTRAAGFVSMALPVALVAWLGAALVCWRFRLKESPLAAGRGVVAGLGLLLGVCTFDWVPRALALRANPSGNSFCGTGYTAPEEALYGHNSLLQLSPMMWGAATLWLGMWAFSAASASLPKTSPVRHPSSPVSHPVDLLWNGVRGVWRALVWTGRKFAPVWVLALALAPLFWPAKPQTPMVQNLGALCLALSVWPLAVGTRQARVFAQTQTRPRFPAHFVLTWRALLSGFVLSALLVLPLLLWAQSRFERDFAFQFAPIERGQMVAAMRAKQGLPMQ